MSSDDDNSENDAPVIVNLAEGVANFEGTDAKDHVQGNAMDNFILGSTGNDLLGGREGADTLQGGLGNDRLFGSPGDDIALGGEGNDKIFLGDGKDTTGAPDGSSQDAGDDFIRGGAGADNIFDTLGSNQIFGDLGPDQIFIIDGLQSDGSLSGTDSGTADTVHGGYGNDTLVGDEGDILTGGIGEDTFVVATPLNTLGAPAVLTDFDLRDDLFSIVFIDGAPADPTVRFSYDGDAGLIRAAVDGQDVATLHGLSASDIPFIQTFVTTLTELMSDAA